ncbi:protein-arginine deiminase type-2-like isoform X2 [Branchiostoma floridae]|uniref:Protein-arginine deiminase type-2-like isoform X2 n=1 Tax=Branchiostoma floridae TaxID=7739 RepID=A0A9J7KFQ6_BRAFL|nr:protein-arginine deiminase type-2-like isoform X2 [Branchiostoma floridae]
MGKCLGKLFDGGASGEPKPPPPKQKPAVKARTIRLTRGASRSEVIVVGQYLAVDLSNIASDDAVSYEITPYPKDDVIVSMKDERPRATGNVAAGGMDSALAKKMVVYVYARSHSVEKDDKLVTFEFSDANGRPAGQAELSLTAYFLSLDVDCDRDGVVEVNNPHKGTWEWGPRGHGAVLLVNNDNDDFEGTFDPDNKNSRIDGPLDIKDMSPMVVRMRGPPKLPAEYSIRLSTPPECAERMGVFCLQPDVIKNDRRLEDLSNMLNEFLTKPTEEAPDIGLNHVEMRDLMGNLIEEKEKDEQPKGEDTPLKSENHVMGPDSGNVVELDYRVDLRDNTATYEFAVEGLHYPDTMFDGQVSITLTLQRGRGSPIYEDTVVFQVAPWIMTPNTLPPLEAFVCEMEGGENLSFIQELQEVTSAAGVPLVIVPQVVNRGDRWMQGKDFGYVTRFSRTEEPNSLDSFGNLEVSPPVTANGKKYPLGRILIGSTSPTNQYGRRMMKVVRSFLKAQRVQSPVELYSDWLAVGHIDEFMTFIPARGGKGFRLLLASPDACYAYLGWLQSQGHGNVPLFEGKERYGFSAAVTVDQLLQDSKLREENQVFQDDIDWNRDKLKRELGLTEGDIIDIPALFKDEEGKGAGSFFPDMVNMIVLGRHLGIPKPFGPIVDGACALESYVKSLLQPLGLSCNFIDDWSSYHLMMGEVHCGTNTLRKPFNYKWWHVEP